MFKKRRVYLLHGQFRLWKMQVKPVTIHMMQICETLHVNSIALHNGKCNGIHRNLSIQMFHASYDRHQTVKLI